MADRSDRPARPLIVLITRDTAPQIAPAPISRTWMSKLSETRKGWPNRCLPMLTANQSGWELRNRCAFTATWLGQENGADVMITPDQSDTGQFLPVSHFGPRHPHLASADAVSDSGGLQLVGPRTGKLSEGRRVSFRGHSRNRRQARVSA